MNVGERMACRLGAGYSSRRALRSEKKKKKKKKKRETLARGQPQMITSLWTLAGDIGGESKASSFVSLTMSRERGM